MYSGFVKLLVSIMNPVPYAKPTIAGVKAGDKQVRHIVFVEFVIAFCLLEMMEVVELIGIHDGEVVARVVVHPHPCQPSVPEKMAQNCQNKLWDLKLDIPTRST